MQARNESGYRRTCFPRSASQGRRMFRVGSWGAIGRILASNAWGGRSERKKKNPSKSEQVK